jgi:O-antigen/teichoic acid export membrane protein
MWAFITAYGLLGSAQAASVIFGLVRNKVLASLLGPYGVGIIGQAKAFLELFSQVGTLGITGGAVKLIAEYRTKEAGEKVNRIIVTVIWLFSLIGLLVTLLSTIFSRQLGIWVFDDPQKAWIVGILAIAGFFYMTFAIFFAIFRALDRLKQYVAVVVIGYAVNLVATVGLIVAGGLVGAIYSLLAASIVNVIVGTYVLRRNVLTEGLGLFRILPDKKVIQNLMRFVGPLISIKVAKDVGSVFLRSGIIRTLGVEANGIFEVIWGVSMTYMGLFNAVAFSYGMPQVAASLEDPSEIARIQNNALKLGILLVTPLTIGLIGFRDVWIPLLFSHAFLSAAPFLIWQLGGDIFRVARVSMNISILPLERFGFAVFEGVFSWGAWAIAGVLMIPAMGLMAIPVSYFVVNLLVLVISFFYQTRRTQYRTSPSNRRLVRRAAPLAVIGFLLANGIQNQVLRMLVAGGMIGISLLILPERKDYREVYLRLLPLLGKRTPAKGSDE